MDLAREELNIDEQRSYPTIKINYDNRMNIKRPTWHEYFIEIAKVVSRRSHDAQTQMGCVIVDQNNRILATGYNGFPPGCDDKHLPNLRPDKYPFMVHAEMNAIASSRLDLRNSKLYVTHLPCRECTKAIVTAGISLICFENLYQNEDSSFVLDFFKRCGITAKKLSEFAISGQ